jgi:hypothetical protein
MTPYMGQFTTKVFRGRNIKEPLLGFDHSSRKKAKIPLNRRPDSDILRVKCIMCENP